ncbi:sodium/proline symporter PutP [Myceligenerans pegani]|uniref:Sodium/proline symporter n=1 Tax=Myceligenerans pegani TaxID=2776917 RepID=A0ABR9N270_9MICO|nr:sodium/proline symporter PutP [Myceligenerans sp. TRM 65318]MBE1877743.1 sodium/proline symporter PutP [Myceligenerans sp. TRM 65318]MBE3020014.1 sodium/proline symporter PutP [Myceligenerans sp. TRM 65318]
MSPDVWKTIAIVAYLAVMLGIGYAAFRRTDDLDDYMLGGRRLSPGVAALSAGASDMSGWLLMGLPGAIYVSGLVESWIAIGLTVGAWLNWKFVAPRLRAYTETARNSITIPSYFENRLRDTSRLLRVASGAIILVFFTFYVSSGMVAGGTFFEGSFGLDYTTGIWVVGGVTLAYTLFGGFLGATWTDVAQGSLMLLALVAVPVVAFLDLGGWEPVREGILAAETSGAVNHLSFLAGASVTGVISAAAWGLGYFGQPHIIVRFMAIRSPRDAVAGRRIGISWMIVSTVGAIVTGLVGVAYVNVRGETLENPETVFLYLSQVLFHPLVAGLVLAAVLAAIMSTISSQLIVSSSALVEDLVKIAGRAMTARTEVALGRLGVLLVAVIAGLIAFDRTDTILDLVGFAWAGFGAAFGPLVILSLYWRRLTRWGALAGMVVGATVAFVWGRSPLADTLYEIVPGFVLGGLVAIVVSLLTPAPSEAIREEFAEATRRATAKEAAAA